MRSQPGEHAPEIAFALDYLLSSGGKRIRVAVTLLVGLMFKADSQKLITLAGAIELLHTATLVHDDLIDNSLFRRGIPTLNAKWTPAATVLTGDFIFARAAELSADVESVRLMKLFAQTLEIIVNGEITQMLGRCSNASRESYERRIYAKTASLFESAATSAAVLANQDETIVQRLGSYGRSIGMAFQIMDDVLDYTGEQETVGKPVASDLRQGLITLPVLLYLDRHADDAEIKLILEGKRLNEAQMQRLLASIRQSGAIEQAVGEAEKYIESAIEQLTIFPATPERLSLESLARYIVQRRK